MSSFIRIACFATLALFASANALAERDVTSSCTNPTVVSSTMLTGGVMMNTIACNGSSSLEARQAVTPPALVNVCGAVCQTFCSNGVGELPPITEDCQEIKTAIAIFEGNHIETFNVQPQHIQELTYETCRYFFENLGDLPLEYCWKDLSTTASAAGSTCFPPIQPTYSEADCKALDQTGWIVGASHSNDTASGM